LPLARIALVTYEKFPDLSHDDQLLAQTLVTRGAEVAAVIWDDPAVDWDRFDVVVVRSTWDYHLRLEAFAEWIDARARGRARVENPTAVLRWNSSKGYLREIAARGVATVPTRFVERGEEVTLSRLAAETGWGAVVVKPVVSASAYATWRTVLPPDDASEERFAMDSAERALMVQPLIEAIVRDGELSLMFIDGAFSHAVRKRARAGEWRVQAEYGGSAEPVSPEPATVMAARTALAVAPAPSLYARADGFLEGGRFVLTELELLEPSLFLRSDPQAAERLAAAILRRVRR
jgi:glutathione synthase/RimK-type ligase-like ATP-grasp enzyme